MYLHRFNSCSGGRSGASERRERAKRLKLSRDLNQSGSIYVILGQFVSPWVNLAQSGSVSANHAQSWSIWINLCHSGSMCVNLCHLHQHGSISLGHCTPFLHNLAQSGSMCINLGQCMSIYVNPCRSRSIWFNLNLGQSGSIWCYLI